MTRRTSTERVYQLDIRLTRIEPPIWRRIVVSDQITLAALHHLLQVVMGWEHSHLHQFLVGETRYGEPDPEYDDDMQSDRRVAQLLEMVDNLNNLCKSPLDWFFRH